MRYVSRSFVLITVLAALAGCNSSRPSAAPPRDDRIEVREIDFAKFDSDATPLPEFKPTTETKSPLRLTLSASPNLSRDDLSFRLRVENAGKEAFDWDEEFIGGLLWRVTLSDGTKFFEPDVVEVAPARKGRDGKQVPAKTEKRERSHLELYADPKKFPEVTNRFERLEPGKSISREISLGALGRMQSWVEMTLIEGTQKNEPMQRNDFVKFELPAEAALVRVEVDYDPSAVGKVFKGEKLRYPPATGSNALQITLK
jgi:hypothetical protein